MADGEEELEPLFDYSRVQPADFLAVEDDDEPDSSPCFPNAKRRKCASAALKGNSDNKVVRLEDDMREEEEEEDWLPPPPPQIRDASLDLAEDETIQKLRLKKQELASFAWSAEDVMRAVIESAKKELNSSEKSDDPEVEAEEPVKQNVDRPKILISIQDKDGHKQFRVYKDDKFERLFKMYAGWAKCGPESLVFCFDGSKISPSATPAILGLEDDDMIEVHLKNPN
ncbi:unnamed protein product [Spirodela intermedia]|uniref:Rad60/SUMO-like domain-containing protein n=1 Tax=Spirodela intermedia TaxID=51605 RepID=A0A7I8LGY5_SPIIN|nr:unnamed protein product [Spirodela intermedia]